MSKHKPYKGERMFLKCIIGQSVVRDGILYTSFYKPVSANWWSTDYECFMLISRVNMRASAIKKMVDGPAVDAVGTMLDIRIDNVINRTSIGTTYERILIAPAEDAFDDTLPCRKGCMIYDAFSVDVEKCAGTYGVFEIESDIMMMSTDLASSRHATRLSKPVANCKLKVTDGTSQFLACRWVTHHQR